MMVVHLLWEQADWVRVPAARMEKCVSAESDSVSHETVCFYFKKTRAYRIVVVHGIRIAGTAVQFCLGPQKI